MQVELDAADQAVAQRPHRGGSMLHRDLIPARAPPNAREHDDLSPASMKLIGVNFVALPWLKPVAPRSGEALEAFGRAESGARLSSDEDRLKILRKQRGPKFGEGLALVGLDQVNAGRLQGSDDLDVLPRHALQYSATRPSAGGAAKLFHRHVKRETERSRGSVLRACRHLPANGAQPAFQSTGERQLPTSFEAHEPQLSSGETTTYRCGSSPSLCVCTSPRSRRYSCTMRRSQDGRGSNSTARPVRSTSSAASSASSRRTSARRSR